MTDEQTHRKTNITICSLNVGFPDLSLQETESISNVLKEEFKEELKEEIKEEVQKCSPITQ